MPRLSRKAKVIKALRDKLKGRLMSRAAQLILLDDEWFDDDMMHLELAKDLALSVAIRKAESQRYLFRQSQYRCGNKRFNEDLDQGSLSWLNDDEFLQKYRCSRENFYRILELIEEHPVFQTPENKRSQAPVAHQLMVFLKFLGTEGSGGNNSNQRGHFAVGYGTADLYRKRVCTAIRSLRDQFYFWPDAEERRQIGKECAVIGDFPHCVGIADGTLFPLAFEPETEDAPDYNGRKFQYSLSTMIICDHKRRIRHYLAGFPGSAHDNRIFKETQLARFPNNHFDPQQYLLGDSAFENSWFMVSSYKRLPNQLMGYYEEKFNDQLARLRFISEHCIGILKGRFPWLRQIRLKITEDDESLKRIMQLIEATVILHNMLIEFREEEVKEWIDYSDFSDLDDHTRAVYEEQNHELSRGLSAAAPKDERRRRLMRFFMENLWDAPRNEVAIQAS